MSWTAPRTYTAGEIITASILNTHIRDNLLEVLQRDGSIPLTANWDAGSYEVRAQTLESDVATGTAPLTIASTTVVTNLNADLVDGQSRALTIDADHTHASTGAEGGQLDHGLALTGLDDDDHTQYQKESLLTTAGDLPFATGASAWARLGIGTVAQVLRVNAGETAPEWGTPSFTSKLLNHTRALDAVSGDVSYTGYGFQPKALIIFTELAAVQYHSWGLGDVALAEMCLYYNYNATWGMSTTQIIRIVGVDYGQTAVLKTLDADGFTLTWTLTGSTSGTITFIVLALG